jgi:hypothetical protein
MRGTPGGGFQKMYANYGAAQSGICLPSEMGPDSAYIYDGTIDNAETKHYRGR